MQVQQIYQELLRGSKDNYHLTLSRLFRLAFGRNVREPEWGFLRKLINMYGPDTVYWAILNSSNIDASGNPLVYVSKVCIGMLRVASKERDVGLLEKETEETLSSMKSYKRPDWENILDGKAPAT